MTEDTRDYKDYPLDVRALACALLIANHPDVGSTFYGWDGFVAQAERMIGFLGAQGFRVASVGVPEQPGDNMVAIANMSFDEVQAAFAEIGMALIRSDLH